MATKTQKNAQQQAQDTFEKQAEQAQDAVRAGYTTFAQMAQTYTDFLTETAQQTFDQSLAQRARFDQMVKDMVKRSHELYAEEQAFALETAEAVGQQMQQATERLTALARDLAKN